MNPTFLTANAFELSNVTFDSDTSPPWFSIAAPVNEDKVKLSTSNEESFATLIPSAPSDVIVLSPPWIIKSARAIVVSAPFVNVSFAVT